MPTFNRFLSSPKRRPLAALLLSCLAAGTLAAWPVHAATTLLPVGSPVRILVPTDDSLGNNWRGPTFNDAAWQLGTNGVGYETGPGGYTGRVVADSAGDWSAAGIQGENRWINGYYNRTQDADAAYQQNDFQPYPHGAGPWSPINFWDGGAWNWNPGDPPWDTIGRVDVHPNGVNNGEEHWVVRRWVSTVSGPLTMRFHFRKANLNGSGATGKIFHNGTEIFSRAVAGNDGTGYTVLVNRTVAVGDVLDFAQTPIGPNGETDDGADGSILSVRVLTGTIVAPIAVTDSSDAWVPGTQGANGWFYGFYNKTGDLDATYDPATDFNSGDPNWTFTGGAWGLGPGDPPWDSIGQISWHPNGDNPIHWVIRRWVSPVSGDYRVQVQFGKENTGCGNGTTLRILQNGVEIFVRTIAFNDSTGINTNVLLTGLSVGDVIDFALDPLGTDGSFADGCDGSRLRATLFPGTTPFVQSIRDCIATDLEDEMKGINASVYLRFPFNVPNPAAIQNLQLRLKWNDGYVASLNGTIIDKKNNPTEIVGVPNADSIADWSATGAQGENGWTYGYYDRSLDGDGTYSVSEFVPFPRDGGGFSPTDFWTGSGWDWFNGNPPWDEILVEAAHPNHSNGGVVDPGNHGTHEHWMIRRWSSDVEGDLRVRVRFRKTNPNCGDGVECKVFHNSVQVYSQSIAFNDSVGRDDVVNLPGVFIGDIIDVVLSPGGGNDNCDGSAFSAIIFSGVETVPWNAAATAARSPEDSVVPDVLDLTPFLSSLVTGQNVLAIHGLNVNAADASFLMAAEITTDIPPTAADDSVTVDADTTSTIVAATVLSNDSAAPGTTLLLVGVEPDYVTVAGGSVRLYGDTIRYTPLPGFTGPDSFDYTISGGGRGQASAVVNLNVVGVPPPTVAITSPSAGAELDACENAAIRASAQAAPGASVTRVDFFASGTPVGSDTTEPYEVSILASFPGAYSLTAVATDDLGHSSTSAPVAITVRDRAPILICPANIRVECTGPLTPVTWTASATDGCDGPVAVTCTPPSGSGFLLGMRNVVCTATDLAGNVGSCSFTVQVADTTPPLVNAHVLQPVQANNVCGQTVEIESADGAGVTVSYVASASDPCGIASFVCQPPSGGVFPVGATVVQCLAVDNLELSTTCTFTIRVRAQNEPPVAVAKASGLCDSATTQNTLTVISANRSNACVRLDGSMSSDPDNDPLTHAWYDDGALVPFAAGVTVSNCYDLGVHVVRLVVDDGQASGSDTVEVQVITACEAVELLIQAIDDSELDRRDKRPLIASLKAACASFERGNTQSGVNQLGAFQNKVRAQVARDHPTAAAAFTAAAQRVMDAVNCPTGN